MLIFFSVITSKQVQQASGQNNYFLNRFSKHFLKLLLNIMNCIFGNSFDNSICSYQNAIMCCFQQGIRPWESLSWIQCVVRSKIDLDTFLKNSLLLLSHSESAPESPLDEISVSFTCSRVWSDIDLVIQSRD